MRKLIEETRKRKELESLYAQLEEPFRILTGGGKTIDEQRRDLFEALRVGELSRWTVAVELVQSQIIREIQWWIDQSEMARSEDDSRQHAEIFLALTQMAKVMPLNGEDLRRSAAEVEN